MTSLKKNLDTAGQLIQYGQLDEAVAILDDMLDASPDSAGPLMLRGLIDCKRGRLLEGLKRLARARTHAPLRTLRAEDRDRIERQGADAVGRMVETDPVQGARILAALRDVGLGGAGNAHAARLIEGLLQRALNRPVEDNPLDVERCLRAVLALSPDHLEALETLGRIHLEEENWLEAIDPLGRALSNNSPNATRLKPCLDQALQQCLSEAFFLIQAGKIPEAEHRLVVVLSHQPHNPIALTYRAMIESQREAFPAALECITAAIEKGARTPDVYRLASYINLRLDRHGEAAAMQTAAADIGIMDTLRAERPMLLRPADGGDGSDLVVGAGFGYGVAELRPFVRTLREVAGFRGDVVLFVTSVTPEMVRFFAEYRIDFIVSDSISFVATLPANGRLIKYYDLLKQMRLEERPARRILLTDVRDVIFQADPFGYDYTEVLFYTLYGSDFRVTDSQADLMWFRRAYGQGVADHVENRPLACCGTVLGTGAGILGYVSLFLEQYLLINPGLRAVQFLDQTIHNYILHYDLVRPSRVLENHDVIGTLMLGRRDFTLDANFRVTGLNGKVPGILHGYDRHPDMLEHIRRIYGGA